MDTFEQSLPAPWSIDRLPEPVGEKMVGAIVGFELPISHLEGKFKIGHERSEADRACILEHLHGEMREFTEEWYMKFMNL